MTYICICNPDMHRESVFYTIIVYQVVDCICLVHEGVVFDSHISDLLEIM